MTAPSRQPQGGAVKPWGLNLPNAQIEFQVDPRLLPSVIRALGGETETDSCVRQGRTTPVLTEASIPGKADLPPELKDVTMCRLIPVGTGDYNRHVTIAVDEPDGCSI